MTATNLLLFHYTPPTVKQNHHFCFSTKVNKTNNLYNKPFICMIFLVPEAPRAVKALVMGQDSILVSWRPPAQPNGVVTHYNVYTQAQNAEPHPNKVPFSHK